MFGIARETEPLGSLASALRPIEARAGSSTRTDRVSVGLLAFPPQSQSEWRPGPAHKQTQRGARHPALLPLTPVRRCSAALRSIRRVADPVYVNIVLLLAIFGCSLRVCYLIVTYDEKH